MNTTTRTDSTSKHTDEALIQAFMADYGTMQKLGKGSKDKYRFAAQGILEAIKAREKTIATLDDTDVLAVIQYIQSSDWSEATREDYWKRWKKLYLWLHKHKGIGTEQVALRTKEYMYKRDKNAEEKKEILTEDEMLRVIHAEPHLCYKAVWAVVYEGGLRIGEALALRIRDVMKNDKGYVLHLPKSKTQKRTIHLYGWATNYLARWLKQHPNNDSKDASLFLNARGEPLAYRSAAYHLKEAVMLASIDKSISPHCLRHSRASHLANHLNEQQMCKFFGWSIGSDMPRTYIRENAIDLDHALKTVYGIADAPESREAGVLCNWCGHRNPDDAEHCDSCQQSMGVESQVHGADQTTHMQRLIMQMIEEKYGSKIELLISTR